MPTTNAQVITNEKLSLWGSSPQQLNVMLFGTKVWGCVCMCVCDRGGEREKRFLNPHLEP